MYISRTLEKKLLKYLNSPEILAVIGPRQCGKTTLLKQIYKSLNNAVFLTFEDREILNIFNTDIKEFYQLYAKGKSFLFIDEFQYAKEGGKRLKYLYDEYKIKVVLSGSSALDLTHQAIKYLVGRIFIFHLFPFSFSEYLSYKNKALYENIFLKSKKNVDAYLYVKNKKIDITISSKIIEKLKKEYYEYALFGGYPRVILSKDREEKIFVLKNIYNTFFLREIRDILQLHSEESLQKLIKALSLQISSLVKYTELMQITGLDYPKLLSYLNILEKTFIIKKITPFCKNKRTEIAKNPKIYFIDNGFRNISIANFQFLTERVDRGALNENFAAGQLIKQEKELKYWRTKSHAEIDFIIEANGENLALEVKSSIKSFVAGKAMYSFLNKYPLKRAVILSEDFFAADPIKKILYLPLFLI